MSVDVDQAMTICRNIERLVNLLEVPGDFRLGPRSPAYEQWMASIDGWVNALDQIPEKTKYEIRGTYLDISNALNKKRFDVVRWGARHRYFQDFRSNPYQRQPDERRKFCSAVCTLAPLEEYVDKYLPDPEFRMISGGDTATIDHKSTWLHCKVQDNHTLLLREHLDAAAHIISNSRSFVAEKDSLYGGNMVENAKALLNPKIYRANLFKADHQKMINEANIFFSTDVVSGQTSAAVGDASSTVEPANILLSQDNKARSQNKSSSPK